MGDKLLTITRVDVNFWTDTFVSIGSVTLCRFKFALIVVMAVCPAAKEAVVPAGNCTVIVATG